MSAENQAPEGAYCALTDVRAPCALEQVEIIISFLIIYKTLFLNKIRNNMTSKIIDLGQKIRTQRKALRISATATAEAAGMSRVTLYRIEKGEASVTMGAYLSAMAALGLDLDITPAGGTAAQAPACDRAGWIPARVPLADYPQLRQLAWQVHGTDWLTPREALDIYERNWRHVDAQALEPHEQQLVEALRLALADGTQHV